MQTQSPSTVTSVEAKNRLGYLIAMVQKDYKDVLIENHGKPRAVLLSYEKYEALQKKLKHIETQQAWNALQKAREKVQKRKPAITNAEAATKIQKATDQAMKELSGNGIIQFA